MTTKPLASDAVRTLIADLDALNASFHKGGIHVRIPVIDQAISALPASLPREGDAGLRAAVVAALDDALLCTRVWEAWSYGTMREDDFTQAADDSEFVAQIVDAVRPFLASRTVETAEELWGVVLDDFGSTDYYDTRAEADEVRKRAPDTGLVRVVTTTIVSPAPEEADLEEVRRLAAKIIARDKPLLDRLAEHDGPEESDRG